MEKVTAKESDDYYQVRPLGSRLGAWASPQSRVIAGREELEGLVKATEARFSDTQRTARSTGVVIACCLSASSSGRGGRAACMTG